MARGAFSLHLFNFACQGGGKVIRKSAFQIICSFILYFFIGKHIKNNSSLYPFLFFHCIGFLSGKIAEEILLSKLNKGEKNS
ncbi:hypothetical protein XENTR_v10000165 [Xenopus tropicalis]|nr:hypothetical protein XENTR_v10000165 [Xenopus tropicalis]